MQSYREIFLHSIKNQDPIHSQPLIDHLDYTESLHHSRAAKLKSIEALDVIPGIRVLDVGSGTGTDAVSIASAVGGMGEVIGIDINQGLVTAATDRHGAKGLPLRFMHLDLFDLPSAELGTFARVRMHRVLQHLQEPGDALRAVVSICDPGAKIVVGEPDWETLAIGSTRPIGAVTKKLKDFIWSRITNPGIGTQLPRLLSAAGFESLHCEPAPLCFRDFPSFERAILRSVVDDAFLDGRLTDIERQQWRDEMEKSQAQGAFLATLTLFIVTGTLP